MTDLCLIRCGLCNGDVEVTNDNISFLLGLDWV